MASTPVVTITPAGPVRPTFDDCQAYEQNAYRGIYGADTYLGNDCQDGQLTKIRGEAIHDANGEILAAYDSFSVAGAIGVSLDRLVKINGLRRKIPTFSTVPMRVVGVAGTIANNLVVTDVSGNQWRLPSVLTIPYAGQMDVLATCATVGAVRLAAGALDTLNGLGEIFTPQYGVQSIVNTADASVGAPVEKDSELRARQAISTMLPSLSVLDGLAGAISAIAGVNRVAIYENDTPIQDANGIPAHAIAVVVDGGDPTAIATIIRLKKGPGAPTYGSTVVPIVSTSGVRKNVAFFYLRKPIVNYALVVTNLGGLTSSISAQIQQSLVDFTNGLGTGEDVERDQAFAAAKLYDGPGSKTFKINSFLLSRDNAPPGTSDVVVTFDESATAALTNVSITVAS